MVCNIANQIHCQQKQEDEELQVVAASHAVAYPRTVVIVYTNADPTYAAVSRTRRPHYLHQYRHTLHR